MTPLPRGRQTGRIDGAENRRPVTDYVIDRRDTPSNTSALIGTTMWDPVGESMMSVHRKLTHYNQFSKVEFLDQFGVLGRHTLNSGFRRNPDKHAAFHTDRIERLAGWKPGALDAAFSSFYVVPGSYSSSIDHNEYFDFHRGVRLCPRCARMNAHLLLHQFGAIDRCPIHRCRLIKACPKCDRPLAPYSFPEGLPGKSDCGRCGWVACDKPPAGAKAFYAEKRRIVSSLVSWFAEIAGAVSGDSAEISLLSPIFTFRSLANVHHVIPGPDWIGCCMAGATRVRRLSRVSPLTEKRAHRVLAAYSEAQQCPPGGLVARASVRQRRAFAKCYEGAMELGKRYSHQFNPDGLEEGWEECSWGFTRRMNECTSAAALAFNWWRQQISADSGPYGKPSSASLTATLMESSFHELWENGPGRVYRLPLRSPRDTLLDDVSSIDQWWTSSFLEGLYLSMLGLTSFEERPWGAGYPTATYAAAMGDIPLILVKRRKSQLVFSSLTRLAPYSDFRALFGRGYDDLQLFGPRGRVRLRKLHDRIDAPERARVAAATRFGVRRRIRS